MSADAIVVGGGVAGLAAADRLTSAGLDVTLLESTHRLGGNLRTVSFAGRRLDMGAEVLVTADPTAIDLCRDLGLAGELVAPAVHGANVWTGQRLRPLPSQVLSRPPGALGELLRSRLLSPLGMLRCGLDLVTPSRAPERSRLSAPALHGLPAGRAREDRAGRRSAFARAPGQ